jgi:hypothetical protein
MQVSENLAALEDPEQSGNFSSYTFTFDYVYSEHRYGNISMTSSHLSYEG